MQHEPATELGIDNAAKKKSKLGVLFFFLYLFFYAGFVAIGVFNYDLLAINIGLNLALFYGIGLIGFAVILGVFYNYLCSRYEDAMNGKETLL